MARRPLRSNASSDEDDVNVTPLLDIVFIMLIFFIVTSTFIKEPGIDIVRPEIVTQAKVPRVQVLVGISATDEIWIDNEQVELNEVRFKVRELIDGGPSGSAVVRADSDSSSRLLIEVLQRVRDAGIVDVQVSTEEA